MYGREMTRWESEMSSRLCDLEQRKAEVEAEKDILRVNDCYALSEKTRKYLQDQIDDAYDDVLDSIQQDIDFLNDALVREGAWNA